MKHDKYKDISESIDLPNALNRRRALLMLGFLFATLPVASHMLARAAVRESRLIPDVNKVPLIGDDPAQPKP